MIHLLRVGTEPERQQVAETQVGFAVAVVVRLPVSGVQSGKAFAVLCGAGRAQQLFVRLVGLLPYLRRGRQCRRFRLCKILFMHGGALGCALFDGAGIQGIAGDGKVPPAVVHFQPDAAFAAGTGRLLAVE